MMNKWSYRAIVRTTLKTFGIAMLMPAAALQAQVYPLDYGQTVNGYQEQFNGTTLSSDWTVVDNGTTANVYTLNGKGVLQVATCALDPNHLLLTGPTYDHSNQEVLARFRVTNFGTGDGPRGGIGVAVTSAAGGDFSRGINLHFRDYTGSSDGGALTDKHLRFLDDLRSWGNVLDYQWAQGAWYWMRVAYTNSTTATAYGKIWAADGLTPEPTDWQVTWTDTQSPARTGFVGITAGSNSGQAGFECDYFLLKSVGLPSVTVAPTAAPPEISGLVPDNRVSYVATNATISFNTKSTVGISATGISLTINGVDQTAKLVIGGTASTRTVSLAASLEYNKVYTVVAKAISADGQDSELSWTFDTFKQDNFSIEAEDFNYSSGHYNDNPAIGANSPYINMIGTPGIDENDPSEGGALHDYRAYDTNTLTGEIVGTKTMSTEIVRQAYLDAQAAGDVLAIDYAVGWIDDGEWLNYTRTFPAGTFQPYARISASADSVTRLDWVTSSASAANQTTSAAGLIKAPNVGSTEIFAFRPLTDAFGNMIVQRIAAGVKTLRFTKVSGSCDLNFFSFVPVTDPGTLPPFVSNVFPAQNATGVTPITDVIATITDRDSKVNASSVQMTFDTNDVTSLLQKATVSGSLQVTYSVTNIYAANSVHTVTLVYADNAATPNKFTNTWQFTITGTYSILPVADAKPVGSGQTSGFTARMVQTSTASAHTLAWTENTLAGLNPIIASGLDETSTLINYNGNGSSGNFPNDSLFSTAFGMPAATDTAANLASETVTYLALSRGFYRFGVNSDDDFWVTEGSMPGNSGRVGGVALGQYDGNTGRGVADTTFDFVAPVDGVYPFRLTYEQGTGGSGYEWFSVNPVTGVRTLINDPNTAGSVKAYRYDSQFQNVVSIAVNPQPTLTVAQNSKLSISAAGVATLPGSVITNAMMFAYHWTKDGAEITGDTAVLGINSATLSIDLTQPWHAGTYQCEVLMPGFPSVKSTACAVTVGQDVTAPTVASIHGSGALNSITINFSEPLDVGTLVNSAFAIDGGLTVTAVTANADAIGNTYQVVLTTSAQTEGKLYTVTINNVADLLGNKMSNVKASFNAYITDPTVKLVIEFYDSIGSLEALTNSVKYQASTPDRVISAPDFQTPGWEFGDNYGARLANVVTAPVSGNYRFYISSDDSSQLYVSSDETIGNWIPNATTGDAFVAYVNGATGQREWGNAAAHPSDLIPLVSGKKYYIMAIYQEGGGGDGCAVGWVLPGADTNIVVIPGSAMGSQKVDPGLASIKIGQQPAAVTVTENRPASFSLTVTNAISQFSQTETVTYQWQRNGVNVASNGNSATYTIALAQIADSGTFQAVLHVPGLSVTSAPAVLTVTKDVTAPVVVSAGTLVTAPTTVGVLFDELVDLASAQTIANYTVSGATVTNATLLPSGKAVALALNAAVVSGATVKVENVKDVASTPNTVASTTLSISFNDLTSKDVGTPNLTNSAIFSDPIYVGSTVALGNGAFEVRAGGSDIWDTHDGFHFTYKEVTGDFEMKVRVESLLFTSTWSKAGLMIRESLDMGSRNYNTVVDPTEGANVWEPNYRADTNGASANAPGEIARVTPVTYPNAWIKLTRAGQVITSFKSTNGVDWIQLATLTVSTNNPYPAKMLVGLCATAHDNGGTNTVAEFRDYTLTTGGTVTLPTMTAKRSASNLVITWDATQGAGFQLYSASTIKGTWAVEGTAPVTANGVVTVTLPVTDASKFFQLKK
jgi:hypothetical protein